MYFDDMYANATANVSFVRNLQSVTTKGVRLLLNLMLKMLKHPEIVYRNDRYSSETYNINAGGYLMTLTKNEGHITVSFDFGTMLISKGKRKSIGSCIVVDLTRKCSDPFRISICGGFGF